jgi:hypothetical protein
MSELAQHLYRIKLALLLFSAVIVLSGESRPNNGLISRIYSTEGHVRRTTEAILSNSEPPRHDDYSLEEWTHLQEALKKIPSAASHETLPVTHVSQIVEGALKSIVRVRTERHRNESAARQHLVWLETEPQDKAKQIVANYNSFVPYAELKISEVDLPNISQVATRLKDELRKYPERDAYKKMVEKESARESRLFKYQDQVIGPALGARQLAFVHREHLHNLFASTCETLEACAVEIEQKLDPSVQLAVVPLAIPRSRLAQVVPLILTGLLGYLAFRYWQLARTSQFSREDGLDFRRQSLLYLDLPMARHSTIGREAFELGRFLLAGAAIAAALAVNVGLQSPNMAWLIGSIVAYMVASAQANLRVTRAMEQTASRKQASRAWSRFGRR